MAGDQIPFRIASDGEANGSPSRMATVDFISPAADPRSGLFRVKLVVDNPNREIKAGSRVIGSFGAPAAE